VGFNVKGLSVCVVCLVFVLASLAVAVDAAPSLALSFYKNNGYGMGNDMNGVWTVNTDVSSDIAYVEFFLDGQLQRNASAAPFNWQFDTDNYTLGIHTIRVVAHDSAGETAVAERQPNFVGFPLNYVATIIGIIVAGFAVALVVSVYRIKQAAKKKRAQMG
jgi:hypothetical protein